MERNVINSIYIPFEKLLTKLLKTGGGGDGQVYFFPCKDKWHVQWGLKRRMKKSDKCSLELCQRIFLVSIFELSQLS